MQTIETQATGERVKHGPQYIPAPGLDCSAGIKLGAAVVLALVAYSAGLWVAMGSAPNAAPLASQVPTVPASQVREVELMELGPGWGMFMEVVGHE